MPISWWRYLAPSLVLSFRTVVLSTLVYINPQLVKPITPYVLAFWTVVALTVLFYLRCSLADPGFQLKCPSDWLPEADQARARALGERLAREEFLARHPTDTPRASGRLRKVVMAAEKALKDFSSSSDEADDSEGEEPLSDVETAGLSRRMSVPPAAGSGRSKRTLNLSARDDAESSGGIVVEVKRRRSSATHDQTALMPGEFELTYRTDPLSPYKETELETQALSSSGSSSKTRTSLMPTLYGETRIDGECRLPLSAERRPCKTLRHSLLVALVLPLLLLRKASKLLHACHRCALTFTFFSRRVLRASLRPYRFLFDYRPVRRRKPAGPVEEDETASDDICEIFALGASSLYQSGERLHFCDRCSQWKLLRTKHCRECRACVRLNDHHCPWLGTCVAERNRVHFVWFLLYQSLELFWVTAEGLASTLFRDAEWLDEKHALDLGMTVLAPRIGLLVVSILLICLLIMCASLLVFHAFLVLSNLTTWETMSWDRISYLKHKAKLMGSPFALDSPLSNLEVATLPLEQAPAAREGSKRQAFIVGPDRELVWTVASRPGIALIPPLVCGCCNVYGMCI